MDAASVELAARVGLRAGRVRLAGFQTVLSTLIPRAAAELSTGAPALYFIEQSGARISSLVTALSAKFTRKATQETTFTFADGPSMRTAIESAARSGEPVVFKARSVGTQQDGTVVAEFEIEWSFKRRSPEARS